MQGELNEQQNSQVEECFYFVSFIYMFFSEFAGVAVVHGGGDE
jgi:hypothetical protein